MPQAKNLFNRKTPTLTRAEFNALAKVMNMSLPHVKAARMVILEGKTTAAAAVANGLLQPAVSRDVRRFREADKTILKGYDRQESNA